MGEGRSSTTVSLGGGDAVRVRDVERVVVSVAVELEVSVSVPEEEEVDVSERVVVVVLVGSGGASSQAQWPFLAGGDKRKVETDPTRAPRIVPKKPIHAARRVVESGRTRPKRTVASSVGGDFQCSKWIVSAG